MSKNSNKLEAGPNDNYHIKGPDHILNCLIVSKPRASYNYFAWEYKQ